jgi:hypothetical protein
VALGEEVANLTRYVERLAEQVENTDLAPELVVPVVTRLRTVTLILRDTFAWIFQNA